jgi:signal transduction histidine kinase
MVVHDLRSPLTAITTSLHLVSHLFPQDASQHPQVTEIIETSQQAVRKMLHRINSLLDISKMESGELNLEMKTFEIQEPIQSVFRELNILAKERKIRLVEQIDTNNFPIIEADADKIERVMLNLVDNGLKFTKDNTDLVIRVTDQDTAKGFIRVDVIDQGPGVPIDYRERLFDRFVQMKGQSSIRSGVGLGLTFCKMVVEAHGGNIWIEDNPAGGAIFAFTLPIAKKLDTTSMGEPVDINQAHED